MEYKSRLLVLDKSIDLSVKIYQITKLNLKDLTLFRQLRSSALSIPSNIAEGDQLDSVKQNLKHLYIARGSLSELKTQLLISKRVKYINDKDYQELLIVCDIIGKMLNKLIKVKQSYIT